jgi:surface polysaccharide O-acyltransferase-like enzyme
MLNAESSSRLNIVRFPLIVAVVFGHNHWSNVDFSRGSIGAAKPGWIDNFVREILSQGIGWAAVCLFFLMSGYLFFLGFEWSWSGYFKKVKSRVKTLVIPLLVWNIATLAVFALAQSLPFTRDYFSGNSARIATFSFLDSLKAVSGIDRMPISYQFWFIRDLIIMIAMAPLISFLINKVPGILVAALGFVWFFRIWPLEIPSSEAAFFFTLGAVIARNGKSLFAFDGKSTLIFIAYASSLIFEGLVSQIRFVSYLHNASIVLGVLTILCLTKVVFRHARIKESMLALAGCSFFVFAAHEPLLTMTRKIAYKIIQPASDIAGLTLFFLIPTLLVFVLVKLYKVCLCYFPRSTHLITGGS